MTKPKYSPVQIALLNLLENPKTLKQLSEEANMSLSYIRGQIKDMEIRGWIEKVDERVPHIYRVPDTNIYLAHKERIAKAKKLLVNKEDTKNEVILFARKSPKSKLPEFADMLEEIVEAIRQLEVENKLIDTL